MGKRVSKYQKMVGQFVHCDTLAYQVVDYQTTKVTSKRGSHYYKRTVSVIAYSKVRLFKSNPLTMSCQTFDKGKWLGRLNWIEVEDDEVKRLFEDLVSETIKSTGKESVSETIKSTGRDVTSYQSGYECCLQLLSDLMDIEKFEPLNVFGGATYETVDEYIGVWSKFFDECCIDTDDCWQKGFKQCWQENKSRFESYMREHWHLFEEKTREQWYQYRNERYGKEWEKQWERNNQPKVSYLTNEFDEMFNRCESLQQVKKLFRQLSMKHHPDHGGSTETMSKVNDAYTRAKNLWKMVA